MNLFLVTIVTTLVLTGMGVALLGSVKVALARRLAIDEVRVGGFVSLFGFALIPGILIAGFLTDQVGRQLVLIGGSCLFAFSLALLGWARSYTVALLSVLLLSTGWSLLINVGNVLLPLAFPGRSPAYSNNLANVFFGLGAFLTPVAAALALGRYSLKAFLTGLAGLALLPAVFAAELDAAALYPAVSAVEAAAPVQAEELTFAHLLADPIMWLLGFALFFYGPLEASLAAWATTFLGERGIKEGTAASMLSAFWLTFMAARLVTAFTLPAGAEVPFLLTLALGVAAILTMGVVVKNSGSALAMVIGSGLLLGPIFPTLMALLHGHFHESLHGRAVGMFFAVGGIGWTLIPIFIGAYAKRTSVTRAFGIAAFTALGLAGVVLGLWGVYAGR